MNAREHFDWSVARATEYLDQGDAPSAMASLVSDLGKHEGTQQVLHPDLQMLMVSEYALGGLAGVRRFVSGLAGPGGKR